MNNSNPSQRSDRERPVQVVDVVRPGFVKFLAVFFAVLFVIWILSALCVP